MFPRGKATLSARAAIRMAPRGPPAREGARQPHIGTGDPSLGPPPREEAGEEETAARHRLQRAIPAAKMTSPRDKTKKKW
ncbi:MAG: hypothetical protein QM278_00975 [Pseudomonadota bacterium]|nr:hypothetical protein [Pseudomonadota bacterium]